MMKLRLKKILKREMISQYLVLSECKRCGVVNNYFNIEKSKLANK